MLAALNPAPVLAALNPAAVLAALNPAPVLAALNPSPVLAPLNPTTLRAALNPCFFICPQVVAIVPHEHGASIIDILCNYVFGIAPLVVAAVAQHIIIRRYKRRIATIKAASAAEPAADTPAPAPFEAKEALDGTKGMGAASTRAGESDTRKVADVHIVGEEQA